MTDQIDVNEIADTLNGKVDLADGANQGDVDYVIETQLPNAGNNYSWYRLYKSGWVEQGGINFGASSAVSYTIALPKAMSDSNYTVTLGCGDNTANANVYLFYFDRTTTDFKLYSNHTSGGASVGDAWRVEGMSAIGGS